MATSEELRRMADQMDREAGQQPDVLEDASQQQRHGRLTGPGSSQLGQHLGHQVQSSQRLDHLCSISQQEAKKASTEVAEVEAQGGETTTLSHTPS